MAAHFIAFILRAISYVYLRDDPNPAFKELTEPKFIEKLRSGRN